jgi:VIT1/CCC1 family predicted Fe2+/Mn2+ transporter
MKICKNCNVKVVSNTNICPLCKTVLNDFDKKVSEDTYPTITANLHKYNIITRLFIFLSVIFTVGTIIVNFVTYNGFLWSIIAIASILYFWSIIAHAIKHNINIVRKIFVQTIAISLLTIVIDITIGYIGWSVNYVVPEIIIIANIAALILIIINRMKWYSYILYQIAIAILGFIPVILYFCGIMHELWSVMVSVIISFVVLCGTVIFSDKSVKNELKRRLHF